VTFTCYYISVLDSVGVLVQEITGSKAEIGQDLQEVVEAGIQGAMEAMVVVDTQVISDLLCAHFCGS
jgi:hypothetical protein